MNILIIMHVEICKNIPKGIRLKNINNQEIIIYIYYKALLNAVERAVNFHGPPDIRR